MDDQVEDQPVLNHIQRLVAEEHRLHEQRAHPKSDRKRLEHVQVGSISAGTSCASDAPFVRSALTRTMRKFARHRLLRIMSRKE
jgi:hypothetical protein